jgi:hypothetical protein
LRRAAGLYYHGDPEVEPSEGELRQFKEWSRLLRWVDRLERELSADADQRFSWHEQQQEVVMSDRERDARELRLEIGKLRESEKALEGLILVDPGEEYRLGLVREALRERTSRLTDLSLEASGARR